MVCVLSVANRGKIGVMDPHLSMLGSILGTSAGYFRSSFTHDTGSIDLESVEYTNCLLCALFVLYINRLA